MTAAAIRVEHHGAQFWIAVSSIIATAVGGMFAIARILMRSRADRAKAKAEQKKTALDALLNDADRMRDMVFARLDAQQTRIDSLQAQLDAAREINLEQRATMLALKSEIETLRVQLADERAKLGDLRTQLAVERSKRETAEKHAATLAAELKERMRALASMHSTSTPKPPTSPNAERIGKIKVKP